jgi:hypothetical protein
MAGFPIGTPVLNLVAQVGNPANAQNTDPSPSVPLSIGRHGDLLVSETHGKYANAAMRGNVFYMSHVIAGTILPVNAASLVSKFTLWNPAGSGKIVELIEFTMGLDSATEVVNGYALAWQASVTTSGGAPGTLTALVNGPTSTCIGGPALASVCTAYSAATLTNAAVLPVYPLGLNEDATAVGRSGNFSYNFDGKWIFYPNTIITFVTTVASSTAAPCGLTWAEYLP